MFIDNEELVSHIGNKKHFKFSINDLPDITWDDVFDCLSYALNHNYEVSYKNFGLIIRECYVNQNIKKVADEFNKLDPNLTATAHLYVSLSNTASTHGLHNDPCDVLFWQVIGSTRFTVIDRFKVYEYDLVKNDLLYIPKGFKHNTNPLSHRVGISFGLESS